MNDEYARMQRLQQAVQTLHHADLNRHGLCADIHRRADVLAQREREEAWDALVDSLKPTVPRWLKRLLAI